MNTLLKLSVAIIAMVVLPVAHAQVALVAGAKSTASTLSAEQVASLYLGKSDDLPGVGTALLLDQPESSPVREMFYSKAANKTPAQVKAVWSRLVFSGKGSPPKEISTTAEIKRLVAANPNVIGYIEKGAVDGSVKVLFSVE